ncbi:precorrin-6Y C5,15-methyltransferase (decarboxylating) subunit CbiT [Caldiplasma sukawensis]
MNEIFRIMNVPGIPDSEFFRDDKTPMTKEEIRALSISKLRLFSGNKCIDAGCGTGSVAVEMSRVVGNDGLIIGIDRSKDACELTVKNFEKLSPYKNYHVLNADISDFRPQMIIDRLFIGGGIEASHELLKKMDESIRTGFIVVSNTIQLQSTVSMIKTLEDASFNVEVVEVNISTGRKTSTGYAMLSRNPVYIVTGEMK